MEILFLNPGRSRLKYGMGNFASGLFSTGMIENDHPEIDTPEGLFLEIQKKVSVIISAAANQAPEAVVIRVLYGGEDFKGPVLYSPLVRKKLMEIAQWSPINIPAVIDLADASLSFYPDTPVVLVFETSFFVDLPLREQNYALDPAVAKGLNIRKYGFHGLQHEASCKCASLMHRRNGMKKQPAVLSICLDHHSEAAAAIGMKPYIVTGGTTPLDGLIGDTSCGDIDTGIMLQMAEGLHWGPDLINRTLTQESGFTGLTGRKTTLKEVFQNDLAENQLAREVFLYKLLMVCGTAISAVGALDYIVFSGKYKTIGSIIGPWLVEKLKFMVRKEDGTTLNWMILPKTLEEVIAGKAEAFIKERRFAGRGAAAQKKNTMLNPI